MIIASLLFFSIYFAGTVKFRLFKFQENPFLGRLSSKSLGKNSMHFFFDNIY